ncbi:MAG TPA: hypothetical protein VHY22_09035 [Chthoniobacteraceae bacterium]|nr:hypothetical protein [Chthoniobacteraceae bacterium]
MNSIIQLRQLLAERFPAAAPRHGLFFPTGVAPLDAVLGGGLWKGTLTELSTDGAGCLTVLNAVICACAAERRPVAIIDGGDGFDPQPLDAETLAHLLWVRCRTLAQFLKAADLVLRDGNLPIVLLDLRGSARGELKRIPGATWYRLQRIVAQSAVACLITTPWFMVSSAHYRVRMEGAFRTHSLDMPVETLFAQMDFQLVRRHGLTGTAAAP